MLCEFMAEYSLVGQYDTAQRQAVDYLLGTGHVPDSLHRLADAADLLARLQLLAQVVATGLKDYARAGSRRQPGGLPQLYSSQAFQTALEQRRQALAALGLLPGLPDLTSLPAFSFGLHFTFTLRTPYISRDEADLHVLDNPVRKDKVFGLPMVAPTGWKGALRAAMMQELTADLLANEMDEKVFIRKRLQIYRLFGNEKDGAADFLNRAWAQYRVGPRPEAQAEMENWEKRYCQTLNEAATEFEQILRDHKYRVGDIEGFQGCLHFYPTFFAQLGLEVINPHDRQSNAGQQPIYFECVPSGAQGDFALLYVPFDRVGEDAAETRRQLANDLSLVAVGVEAMLTRYGFGAKTSSGFGLVKEEVTDGVLTLRAAGLQAASEPAQVTAAAPETLLPRYLEAPGRLKLEYRGDDCGFRYRSEAELKAMKKADRQLYDKAKTWWEREGRALAETAVQEPEPAARPAPSPSPSPPVAEWKFMTISELPEVAQKAATLLREGGAA